MKTNDISCKKAIRSSFHTLKGTLLPIFLFEIIYKVLTRAVFRPLILGIMQTILSISGYNAVFNENILSFFTSFGGVLTAIILIPISALAIYFEFAVIVLMAYYFYQGRKIRLNYAMKMAVTTLGSLKNTGILGFSFYALLLLPFGDMGISSSLLPSLSIPNFVSGELTKTLLGSVGLIVLSLVTIIIVVRLTFVLPVMILERLSFWKAAKKGSKLLNITKFKIVVVYGFFLIIWLVLMVGPWIIINEVFKTESIIIMEFNDIFSSFTFTWKSFVYLAVVLLTELFQLFLTPMLLTLNTIFYTEVGGEAALKENKVVNVEYNLLRGYNFLTLLLRKLKHGLLWIHANLNRNKFYKRHSKKLRLLLIGIIALLFVSVFWRKSADIEPVVMGHRGSGYGVENTLEAIQAAIDVGAEYAEIDIMLSADNIPVVMHDINLKRLSGANNKIYELTAEELSNLQLSQNGYQGKIPTLDEVIKYCYGKIKLNIEYKLHGYETEDLVRLTMKIIKNNKFQDQCVFQALDYKLTQQMKEYYPEYVIGYVVYGNVGSINKNKLRKLNVDFLSVEEGFVTKRIIKECRKAGIPIYVWTVNSKDSMERFWRMGVNGMITDEPELAKLAYNNVNGTLKNP